MNYSGLTKTFVFGIQIVRFILAYALFAERGVMNINKPTLLLDKNRAVRNIERMAKKAKKYNVRFRPHFKTHQAAHVGVWFREFGVSAITVSSLDMAWYFAQYGWKDITVAFPVNILEIEKINALAGDIHLHLLVESPEIVQFLEKRLLPGTFANIWIKIDTGYQRTGIEWHQFERTIDLANRVTQSKNLMLQGILTHAGQTYHARSKGEVQTMYTDTVTSMNVVRGQLGAEGFANLEISVGDTPGCSIVKNLGEVNEIRPGNFVFYDVMQLAIGACKQEDIAVAVACPVVAKHEERHELVLYGGAVHLSKESIAISPAGSAETAMYGYIVGPVLKQGKGLEQQGWGQIIEHTYVSKLSQEHGIVKTDQDFFQQVHIGDVLLVLPVHSCLTANLLRKYVILDGEVIAVMKV
jgi:D-serine deaminase-like pyridoxal phosphate-dependent protein